MSAYPFPFKNKITHKLLVFSPQTPVFWFYAFLRVNCCSSAFFSTFFEEYANVFKNFLSWSILMSVMS